MGALTPPMIAALAAGIWFGMFVATQWGVLHLLSPSRRARVLVLGYGGCCIGCVITIFQLVDVTSMRPLSFIFASMTAGCLFVLYAPFYYVVTNSLSVQSMVLLAEGEGRLARKDLREKAGGHRLLRGRLETLVKSGYVVKDGAAFRITRRGRWLIGPFLWLKTLWKLGPGG